MKTAVIIVALLSLLTTACVKAPTVSVRTFPGGYEVTSDPGIVPNGSEVRYAVNYADGPSWNTPDQSPPYRLTTYPQILQQATPIRVDLYVDERYLASSSATIPQFDRKDAIQYRVYDGTLSSYLADQGFGSTTYNITRVRSVPLDRFDHTLDVDIVYDGYPLRIYETDGPGSSGGQGAWSVSCLSAKTTPDQFTLLQSCPKKGQLSGYEQIPWFCALNYTALPGQTIVYTRDSGQVGESPQTNATLAPCRWE